MSDQRVGQGIRALRRRRGWRQLDLGAIAGVSQSLVSLIERGHVGRVSVRTLRVVAAAVDAEFVAELRWRGGALDRLLDERHAALAGAVVRELRRLGWRVEVEVSFSHFGERGSIDILAFHAATGSLLVIEIKTQLTSLEETLRRVDVKARLAPEIARERFGVAPRSVSRLIVLPRSATTYRQIDRHAAVLDTVLPVRGAAIRTWLRAPVGRLAGLWVVSFTNARGGMGGARTPDRVRKPVRASTQHREAATVAE